MSSQGNLIRPFNVRFTLGVGCILGKKRKIVRKNNREYITFNKELITVNKAKKLQNKK